MIAICLTLLASGVFLAFDARSAAATLFLAAVVMFSVARGFRPKFTHLATFAILSAGIGYGVYSCYVYLVINADFGGLQAQQVAAANNPYNPFELLTLGRSDVAVGLAASFERPFLGYGSWAEDQTGEYKAMQSAITERFGYSGDGRNYIPAHSVLFGAWLWAGILGLVGMALVGLTMMRLFIRSLGVGSPFVPALCIYFLDAVWAFFFSPLAHIRNSFPFVIALLLLGAALNNRQKVFGKTGHYT